MKIDSNCLFCKMVAGQIETKKVYEDDQSLVFHDIDPQAPVHVLIVPKKHITSISQAEEEDEALLGHLLLVAKKMAKELNVEESGYRLAINAGADAGQAVNHIHIHLLGGRKMTWPPG